MASNIPIRDITLQGTPAASSFIVFDDGQMKKGLVSDLADGVRPVASQGEAQAGVDNAKTMTPLRVKDSIAAEVGVSVASQAAVVTAAAAAAAAQSDIDTHEANTSNPHSVTKAQVGLGNVDNTTDAGKPVSTAQAAADAAVAANAANASNLTSGAVPTARMPALTGDVTSSAGAVATTIANNAVTNAKSAQMAAATLKGNPTGSTANATDFTIQGLTARGAPDATNDKLPIYDTAAGTIKYVTPAQIASSATAGVSSIAGNTGAFTLSRGITNSGNDVRLASGTIVDSAASELTTFVTVNAIMLATDTLPTNIQGTQIIQVSITPKTTTNKLRVRFNMTAAPDVANNVIMAMFLNSNVNAICAKLSSTNAGFSQFIYMEHEFVPAATTSQTISIRVGTSNAGNLFVNGNAAGRLFGGVNISTLVAEEIVA